MVRRPTGQLAGQPVGRNRLKGQAFGSVLLRLQSQRKRGAMMSVPLRGSVWLSNTLSTSPEATRYRVVVLTSPPRKLLFTSRKSDLR
jgi:hypothetical protein